MCVSGARLVKHAHPQQAGVGCSVPVQHVQQRGMCQNSTGRARIAQAGSAWECSTSGAPFAKQVWLAVVGPCSWEPPSLRPASNTQGCHACFEPPCPCQIGGNGAGTACLATMQLRNRPQLRTSASLLLAGLDSSPASGALSLPDSLPAAGCGFVGFSGSACCSEWVDTESLLGALLLLLLASLLLWTALLGLALLLADVAWDTSVAALLIALSGLAPLPPTGCFLPESFAIDGVCLPFTTVDQPLLSGGG